MPLSKRRILLQPACSRFAFFRLCVCVSSLAFSVVRATGPQTNNEHWILEIENMGGRWWTLGGREERRGEEEEEEAQLVDQQMITRS